MSPVLLVRRTVALMFAGLALSASRADAQHVQGLVLYSTNDGPVAFATVRLVDGRGRVLKTTSSGPDGRFSLPVGTGGEYWVHVEHLTALSMVDGPLTLEPTANTWVLFRVAPQPIALEGMSVEVEGRPLPLERVGFLRRRESSSGYFIGPDQVKARHPLRASDLLRSVPGVQYVAANGLAGFSGYPLMTWTERNRFDPRPCFPRVYLDGVVVEAGGASSIPQEGFDQIVPVHDVVAMEVYRSPAELPAQFAGLTACGVILVWTVRGGR